MSGLCSDLYQVRMAVSYRLRGMAGPATIAQLVTRSAPIDAYGMGTKMGLSADAPALDTAYRLVAYGDRPVMKLSTGKVSLPGPKQIYRAGAPGDDVIALRDEPAPPDATPLLVQVMQDGHRIEAPADQYGPADDVHAARQRCAKDMAALSPAARLIRAPETPEPHPSPTLRRLADQLRDHLHPHHPAPEPVATP